MDFTLFTSYDGPETWTVATYGDATIRVAEAFDEYIRDTGSWRTRVKYVIEWKGRVVAEGDDLSVPAMSAEKPLSWIYSLCAFMGQDRYECEIYDEYGDEHRAAIDDGLADALSLLELELEENYREEL
jgi:hypothetical protein